MLIHTILIQNLSFTKKKKKKISLSFFKRVKKKNLAEFENFSLFLSKWDFFSHKKSGARIIPVIDPKSFITLDERGFEINNFIISPRKHIVGIGIALGK